VLLANSAFTVVATHFARPILRVDLATSRILRAALAGLGAWSLSSLLPDGHLGWVALRLCVFGPTYVALLLAVDARSRSQLQDLHGHWKRRRAAAADTSQPDA
jgi:hypothetical protein